jgi:hypothetical protein
MGHVSEVSVLVECANPTCGVTCGEHLCAPLCLGSLFNSDWGHLHPYARCKRAAFRPHRMHAHALNEFAAGLSDWLANMGVAGEPAVESGEVE